MIGSATSADYINSDNTHPTFLGATASTLLSTPGGNVNVQHATAGAYPDGKNPTWNTNGHDRLGWGLTPAFDLGLDAGPDATILECETFESEASFSDKVFSGPWYAWTDYGDGAGEDGPLSEESFDLIHTYTAGGTYTVDVIVEGAYGTLWNDSATVTVRTAENAVQDLIAAVNALQASGALKAGQANGLRLPLSMALSKLGHGLDADAQNMINDFITKVASSPLSAANKQALTEAAQRAFAAAGCTVGPVGPPPHGREKPDLTAAASTPVPEDLPEELWVEFEGAAE
jgi:hypothetical protein